MMLHNINNKDLNHSFKKQAVTTQKELQQLGTTTRKVSTN